MKIYYNLFFLIFCFSGILAQGQVAICFSNENEINDFKNEFPSLVLKSTFPIDESKFEQLRNDAIKTVGSDENVVKLKHFFTMENYYENAISYLTENKIKFSLISSEIIPPPGDIAPTTPNYLTQQTYISANPGLNMEAVWNLGYNGQNCKIHNIEYGFNKNHEEFNDTNCNIATGMTVNSSASISYTEHGTATMGVLFGHNGTYGITGIAHGAQQVTLYPEWQISGYSRTNAITQALNNSTIGDIIVYEMQSFGLNGTSSNPKYVPAEFDVLVWNLTKALTDGGRIVVAAAGNGFQNLDSSDYADYMDFGDSGAIIVGGATADVTHTIYPPYEVGGVTYSSTYGTRVDVQGWFENVRTTGALTGFSVIQINNDFNQSYMTFTGTSSATAQVSGVATVLQSYYNAQTNNWLTSQQLRTVLKNTGLAQGGDLTKNIGPLPNTLEALNYIQQNLSSASFESNELVLYPNPSSNILYANQNIENANYQIYDLLGKKVQEGIFSNQLNINELTDGIYVIKIHNQENTYLKKIIKN